MNNFLSFTTQLFPRLKSGEMLHVNLCAQYKMTNLRRGKQAVPFPRCTKCVRRIFKVENFSQRFAWDRARSIKRACFWPYLTSKKGDSSELMIMIWDKYRDTVVQLQCGTIFLRVLIFAIFAGFFAISKNKFPQNKITANFFLQKFTPLWKLYTKILV